ncbi:MAG: methyltransferase [Clostridiaceae bacterium]|nr:methyltransferase [Clostridiaceae bacterium]
MILCGREVLQNPALFPLTQDSVLLAYFSVPKNGTRVLDLGVGQGYLGILLREWADCTVDGLELSEKAAAAARENYLRCAVPGNVLTCDWRDLPRDRVERYVLCVANPPYFPASAGPAGKHRLARTAGADMAETLCRAAARALQNGGRFCLCCPPERLPDWLCALRSVGVEPKRLRPVIQQTGTPPCLLLLEGKKGGKPGMRWLKPLALKTRSGVPTSELKAIYGGTK